MNAAILIACFFLGVLLRAFDVGRKIIPLAAWLSPVFLLHLSHSLPPSIGLPLVWLAIFLGGVYAYRGVIPLPGSAYLILLVGLSGAWTLPYIADRLLYQQLPGFTSALIFPVAWVAIEYLSARFSPYGSWGSTAYTQASNLPLVQLASVTGLWGISFLVNWFGSTLNWAWEHQFNWGLVGSAILIYAAVWLIVMLAGEARVAFSKSGSTVRTASVGWPERLAPRSVFMRALAPGGLEAGERAGIEQVFRSVQDYFVETSRKEAAAGAQIIVWPEACLMVFKPDEQAFLRRAADLAASTRATLVIGLVSVIEGPAPRLENKAVLVDPEKGVVYAYSKQKPVPGWEAQVSVRSPMALPIHDSDYGRLGSAICFDLDFPGFIRATGRSGVDLLLVPSSDWEEIKELHPLMATLRAVENGTPLVRPARWGISVAVDALGRRLASTDSFSAAQDVTVAQVPSRHVATLYARLGDWFAWLCLLGLAGVLGRVLLQVI